MAYNRFASWQRTSVGPASVTLTGDVSGQLTVAPGGKTSAAITLSPAPGQPAGVYGSAASAPNISVDQLGRVQNSSAAAQKAWGLITAVTLAWTGDASGGPTSFSGQSDITTALTLATVNGSPGSFGGATKTLTATVNAKGLVTVLAAVTPLAIVTTVSALGGPIAGGYAHVTDSTVTLAAGLGNAVVGGGTHYTPVYSDGADWLIG